MVPLLIPITAAVLLRVTRSRRPAAAAYVPAAAAVLTLVALLLAGDGRLELSLWRPTELYGEGLAFDIAAGVLPYALLAAAAALRVDGVDEWTLLHFAAALAAIAASNLLAVVITWAVLAAWSNWRGRNLWQLAAIAPLFAAAAGGGDAPQVGTFVVLAAMLRARGSAGRLLEALPAFALLSRQIIGGPGLLLLGAAAIVLGTLGGRRWLATGLIGFVTLAAGLDLRLEAAAVQAAAIALVVAESGHWRRSKFGEVASGLLVGGLPLLVALLAGSATVPLLLVPAAALLAAPTLSGAGRSLRGPASSVLEQAVAAWPIAVAAGVVLSTAQWQAAVALPYGIGAVVLALLMSAGPRWLYRQPAYVQLVERTFRDLGAWAGAILDTVTAALRGLNAVLEGESSTLWLLLILLIVVQALAG